MCERVIAPCCGQDRDYCECPALVRAKAYLDFAAREDCPPAPKLPSECYDDPPF